MAPTGVPKGFNNVVISIVCTPCTEAIEFYKRAFGAEEVEPRLTSRDGSIAHAELRIGDTIIMLGDEWPDGPTQSPTSLGGTTAALFLYTEDVEAVWQRALDAGAVVIYPLELQFYGDKSGRVRDPFGHTWGLAQRVEDVPADEMVRRMAAMFEESTD